MIPAQPDSSPEALLGRLVSAGVELSSAGNDLAYSGSAAALQPETLAALRAHKAPIVVLLQRNRARGVERLGATTWEQQRMEWRHRTDRNPATYNVCVRMELRGELDTPLLASVVAALVERHEILRTRFAAYGPYLLQEIMAPSRTPLQVLEPSALVGASSAERADWCARRGAAPFDLAAEPPARWCYAPIDSRHSLMLLTFHHIACDGWSIERLLLEFELLCRLKEELHDAPALPPVRTTPREFALWETQHLTERRVETARSFWSAELRDAVLAPRLRCWRGRTAPGRDASCLTQALSAPAVSAALALANALGVSEFALYFAGFALLLHEETGLRSFSVVIAVANRTRPEHEEVIGLTRNAQPVCCGIRKEDTLGTVARRISAGVERALSYDWFPIGLITPAQAAAENVDVRRLPITFGFTASPDPELCFKTFTVAVHDVFLGAARAELSLLVRRRSEGAEAFFEHSSDGLSSADARRLASRYVEIITEAVASTPGVL